MPRENLPLCLVIGLFLSSSFGVSGKLYLGKAVLRQGCASGKLCPGKAVPREGCASGKLCHCVLS